MANRLCSMVFTIPGSSLGWTTYRRWRRGINYLSWIVDHQILCCSNAMADPAPPPCVHSIVCTSFLKASRGSVFALAVSMVHRVTKRLTIAWNLPCSAEQGDSRGEVPGVISVHRPHQRLLLLLHLRPHQLLTAQHDSGNEQNVPPPAIQGMHLQLVTSLGF